MNHYAELQAAKHCLEQCRKERDAARETIQQMSEAIRKLALDFDAAGWHGSAADVQNCLNSFDKEDTSIALPPEYRDSTDEAVRDAPTCNNSDCRCYDTDADNNCGARDEFGELVTISECHDAILSPPSEARPVAHRMIECPKCGDIGIGLGEHTCNDAPMRPVALDNSYSQRNNHYHCLNSHADAIVKIQQQINSHTAIVHGEIERRLSEMGQKIEKLEQCISEKGE